MNNLFFTEMPKVRRVRVVFPSGYDVTDCKKNKLTIISSFYSIDITYLSYETV